MRAIRDVHRITRLGRGVDARGMLADDAIERAVRALAEVAGEARTLGASRIAAVGTSAIRDARNRDALIERARVVAGVTIEPISGDREASLTFRGALPGIALEGAITVIDVGGGSTEIVRGRGERVERAVSLDVGSVRLFERWLASDPPTEAQIAALEADVDAALAASGATLAPAIVALAGTACTIAAIARGTDASSVHGARVTIGELRAISARLAGATIAERAAIGGVPAGREDVIAAGALLLARLVLRAGAEEIVVSDGGVRWGLAAELLDRAPGERGTAGAPP